MRYPMPEQRPDPLIEAIEAGRLTEEQRAALADVVQTVLLQTKDGAPVRPGMLHELTVADATRYQRIAAAVRANQSDLYPVTS